MNAVTKGSISASILDYTKLCTSVLHNQNTGGDGTTTVNLTGLCKLTTGTFTTLAFSSSVYNSFSITATNSINISELISTTVGYKSGSIIARIDYSFDNFATAGTILTNYTFNTKTKSINTNGTPSLTTGNPAIATEMGKESIVWPTNITVNSGQTIYFRM